MRERGEGEACREGSLAVCFRERTPKEKVYEYRTAYSSSSRIAVQYDYLDFEVVYSVVQSDWMYEHCFTFIIQHAQTPFNNSSNNTQQGLCHSINARLYCCMYGGIMLVHYCTA